MKALFKLFYVQLKTEDSSVAKMKHVHIKALYFNSFAIYGPGFEVNIKTV